MNARHGSAHTLYVGVDIAAATATAAWITLTEPMSAPITVAQTVQGYATLHARLAATGAVGVAMVDQRTATTTPREKQLGFTPVPVLARYP